MNVYYTELKRERLRNIRSRKSPKNAKIYKGKATPEHVKVFRSQNMSRLWQDPIFRAEMIKKQVGWRQYPTKL